MPRGLLLINLGTPESPDPKDVAIYLKEFLMDPFVIDIPAPLRWVLVHVFITPTRSKASSLLYKKVWEKAGSPLLVHTKAFAEKLRFDGKVTWAMRYGNPLIRSALIDLKKSGVDDLKVFPLYPQYSLAATESSLQKVFLECKYIGYAPRFSVVPPFYKDPGFLDAFAERGRPALQAGYDHVLFSFHGLPVRHLKKLKGGEHCFSSSKCCDEMVEANKDCYRAQCYETARGIAVRLRLPKEKYTVCFQSRLGRTPWIQPFTDVLYENLPKEGKKRKKRLVVFSPSFVADCLETLEEIAIRGKESFLKAGGESLTLVPSLNDSEEWVEASTKIIQQL